jgi:pimeloyl-ACP methyl ester carboxylesterase
MVASSDEVQVVVHDLGGHGPLVLFSHATGFHGQSWLPVASGLVERGLRCAALDLRGHGDTSAPPDWQVEWVGFGDDAHAVATALAADGPILGVGHSMGGAALLMAAERDPALFRGLLLFEPIAFPPDGRRRPPGEKLPIAEAARRRRPSFASLDDAFSNFASKPPMSAFTTEALHAYVDHGFRTGDDGQVHLKCAPQFEAGTFEATGTNETWAHLPSIEVPVWVVCGEPEIDTPSMISRRIAERLPAGRYLELDDVDHFGPMTHPERIVELFVDLARSLE